MAVVLEFIGRLQKMHIWKYLQRKGIFVKIELPTTTI
jgi:hypothetical protein